MTMTTLSSTIIMTKVVEAGIIKLGHLVKIPVDRLGNITNIKSSRALRKVAEVQLFLSAPLRVFVGNLLHADKWDDDRLFLH